MRRLFEGGVYIRKYGSAEFTDHLELLGTKFTPAKLEGGAGHNGIVQL